MKKAVIYNRVSTIMQEKANSLEVQVKQCEEFASSKGYEVIEVLTDVESGTKDDRKGYVRLKELVNAKAFDTLIIYETSRISRKLLELLLFIELLQKNDIDFISATEEGYDTTTPEGKFTMSIRLSMIQFERDNTAKRITERLYYKASKGQWLNGKPPRGYKLVDKKMLIDEDEAWVIKDVFKRFLDGESMYKICQLHDLKWGSKQVKRILTNPAYAGMISYGNRKNMGNSKEPILVPGNHESIISLEKFNVTQELLKNVKYRKPDYKIKHVLNGIVKCGKCGHSMRGLSGGSYEKRPYYGCALKRLKFTDKAVYKNMDCDTANIKGEILENAVIAELKNIISNLDSLDRINSKEKQIDLKQLKKMMTKLEQKKERILDAYIDGNLSKKVYQKKTSFIDEEISSLKKELSIDPINNYTENNKEKLIEYFNQLDMKDIKRANEILRLLIDKVTVVKEKGTASNEFEMEIYLNIL